MKESAAIVENTAGNKALTEQLEALKNELSTLAARHTAEMKTLREQFAPQPVPVPVPTKKTGRIPKTAPDADDSEAEE